MPVRPTYPGVYVEEIPSGLKTITGVATSIGAFVGTFPRGLVNEAVQLFGMADFEREYGGVSVGSETSYAIQQFFLNGGSECFVVRVASTSQPVGTTAATPASALLRNLANTTAIVNAFAGRRLRGQSVENPGAWGNALRFEVDYATRPPASAAEESTLFNLSVSLVRTDGDRTVTVASERYMNLSMFPGPDNGIETVNAGSALIQLDLNGAAAIPGAPTPDHRPSANGTVSGPFALNPAMPAGGNFTIKLTVGATNVTLPAFNLPAPAAGTNFTQWAAHLQAQLRAQAASIADLALQPYLSEATVDVIGANTANDRLRMVVRLGRNARPYNPAATVTFTGAGAATFELNTGSGATIHPQQFVPAAGSGNDGTMPVDVARYRGQRTPKTGIYALEDVDLFNILCIPDAPEFASAADMRALYAETEAYCEERRSMLLLDIPRATVRLDQMQAWLADNETLRHPNAVVYFPRTQISDPNARGRLRSIAPSGTIAGLYSRTDTQRGVWKAPAGTEARLRNVQVLDYALTDLENGALNPLGVNCLRTFPVYSNICWGARTMDGADQLASDWKYVPIRRLTLFLEESLYRGTKWVVFEPNDEPLWSQIRLNVGAFMQDLFRKGAFQGGSPRDAYFVRCDAETTTQNDIDNGIVNVEVGFAPLKPAEFVILKIQQIVRRSEA